MSGDAERWLAVPGWATYEVSDMGRIRSVRREVVDCIGRRRVLPARVLRPYRVKKGHLSVCLSDGRDRHLKRFLHQLVLLTFVGPPPKGMQVLHWNDDGSDNRLSNLRYGTDSDNRYDSVRTGRHFQANQTHCTRGHQLRIPNLVPSAAKAGRRGCLACHRANSAVNHARRTKGLTLDMQAISDLKYGQIMRRAA